MQAGRRQHVLHHLDRVVTHDADIAAAVLVKLEQQVSHAGSMYLDADEIMLGMATRHLGQTFAVAEADFKKHRVVIAEHTAHVDWPRLVLDTPLRPQGLEGTLLTCGQPTLAQHEAADLALGALLVSVAPGHGTRIRIRSLSAGTAQRAQGAPPTPGA